MAKIKEVYRLKDGQEVPGTTSIISNNLGWSKHGLQYYYWEKGKAGKGFKDKPEAEAGTIAHYLIEKHIKGHPAEVKKEFPEAGDEVVKMAEIGYLNFREWVSLFDFKPFLTEHPLVSEKFFFGGRLDCLGFIRKRLALVDWKVAKAIYEENIIQGTAYEQLWLENNPDKPLDGGVHILLFHKESAHFSHHFWDSLADAFPAFLRLLELETLHKKIKKLL